MTISHGGRACWHALGMARYRVGDWPGAIDALKRSREIAPGGVKRLEEEINPNNNEWCPDFVRFRAEAEELMGGERNRSGGEE